MTKSTRRTEVRGYHAVREAAKNYEEFSSDLIGDRDVRDYRQIPLEVDPPRHTLFRQALQPLFMSDAIEPLGSRFEDLARSLIAGISARGGGDCVHELALPFVIGCLTVIYNRPQDFDEWVSWGPDVWTAEAHASGRLDLDAHRAQRERDFAAPSQRSGAVLETYLNRVFDAAEAAPQKGDDQLDIWDRVSRLEVDGSPLSRTEMLGIGNVLLAGGRDTVIKLITGLTWHLLRTPADRDYLRANEVAFNQTIAEMVRYLTPLPRIERVRAVDVATPLEERDPDRYVLLSFVSANFDKTIWDDPEVVDIRRPRRPHLGFGFGRHSCMGMNITEHEARAFLRVLLAEWPEWELDGEPEIDWVDEGTSSEPLEVIDQFRSLRVRTTSAV